MTKRIVITPRASQDLDENFAYIAQNNLDAALRLTMILGFDPGKDKCGIAVMGRNRKVSYHEVLPSETTISTIQSLCQQFPIELLVMGDQTTSKSWKQKLTQSLSPFIKIIQVDERYSSLEAKERYWQMYPPTGLSRLIPLGMRTPPRPVDDIVAIVLIERYLNKSESAPKL